MRWHTPYHREKKTKSWFALFPVTVNGETRWLERVTVVYAYDGVIKNEWIPQYFLDEEEVT